MSMRRWMGMIVLVGAGCLPTPVDPADVGGVTSLGFDTDGEPYLPDGTAGMETSSTVGATTGWTGETEDDASGETTVGGGSTTGDPDESVFGPRAMFGDDVRETDLVGVWTMPWEPVGVPDVSLTIADDGAFVWRESNAGCTVAAEARGWLWVENTQLVLHVATWNKRLPWDVEDRLGLTIEPPFRLRLGYSPMGGYLGIAGPDHLLAISDWQGRSYDRIDAGTGPGGAWVAEAELWAEVEGELEPQLIVRDRFSASLTDPNTATLTMERSWWWPADGPDVDTPIETNGSWVDETPGYTAGAATVNGGSFAYDALHLMSFASEQSFRLGVSSDCAL